MDFLRAFQQAQEVGLTKEEFISVWKTESEYKLAMHTKGQVSHEAVVEEKQQNLGKDAEANHCQNKSISEWQHQEENKNSLPLNIEHMCKQLMDKQEQHYQQMQQKYDQMTAEFRSRFEIITNHISNVADCNTESIKLQFMQELELLKQELGKVIKEQAVSQGSGSKLSEMSPQHAGLAFAQDMAAQQKGHDLVESNSVTSSKINHKDKQYSKISQSPQENLKTLPQQHDQSELTFGQETENTLFKTLHGRGQEVKVKDRNSATISLQNIKAKPDLHAVTGVDQGDVSANNMPSIFNGLSFETLALDSSLDDTLKKGSSGASSSSFEAVTNETKHTSRASSVSSAAKSRSASLQSLKENMPVKSDSCSHLPFGSQEFPMNINVSSFKSPFMYSSGKPCKVRVNIETSNRLIVYLHVSKFAYDDDHKWPLVLSGKGFVFNDGSKKYSQIWQVQSVTCQKPISSGGEFAFPCSVCLVTSRNKYPDITFRQLVDKMYVDNNIDKMHVDNNSLTFKWTLQAL